MPYAGSFLNLMVGKIERKNIMNYIEFEKIKSYLNDIKNHVFSYIYYLNNSIEILDKKEIDLYISTIPEIVDDLIDELERIWINYEKENK